MRSRFKRCQITLRFGGRQLGALLPRVELHQDVALPHGLAGLEVDPDRRCPDRSALTVTPRTASTVPMALQVPGQCSAFATIVVTASGGGRKLAFFATAVWTCRALTAARAPTRTPTPSSIRIIRFAMNETSVQL